MEISAHKAAAELAKNLNLRSWEGCVWVRDVDGIANIILAVDEIWLKRHQSIPSTFHGFPVCISDRLNPTAGGVG